MSLWQHVLYNQNGTIQTTGPDRNQPVEGNGRFSVPPRYGSVVKRVDLQSDAGSTSKVWDIRWYEPWRGYL